MQTDVEPQAEPWSNDCTAEPWSTDYTKPLINRPIESSQPRVTWGFVLLSCGVSRSTGHVSIILTTPIPLSQFFVAIIPAYLLTYPYHLWTILSPVKLVLLLKPVLQIYPAILKDVSACLEIYFVRSFLDAILIYHIEARAMITCISPVILIPISRYVDILSTISILQARYRRKSCFNYRI